jgi:hypothetical protein
LLQKAAYTGAQPTATHHLSGICEIEWHVPPFLGLVTGERVGKGVGAGDGFVVGSVAPIGLPLQ